MPSTPSSAPGRTEAVPVAGGGVGDGALNGLGMTRNPTTGEAVSSALAGMGGGGGFMHVRRVLQGGVVMAATACGSGGSVTFDAGDSATVVDARADAPRDAAPDVANGATCNAAQLGAGCTSGPCKVTGPATALPAGATVTVAEEAVPPTLTQDALGSSLCKLTVTGVATAANLTLTVTETAPPTTAVLFSYVSPTLSQLVVTSQPTGSAVEGLVSAPGLYGATERAPGWSPQGVIGLDVSESGNQAALLRNLSAQEMAGGFYDGAHLFLCNGPRILIYNTLPGSPSVLPDVVLGQPDVNTFEPETSSSLFGAAACVGLWSDGTRLVASQGARILIWNTIPTASLTPADIELGQPDFSANTANTGGVSAGSLSPTWQVNSDGTQLVAADRFNNRVLVWKAFPTQVGQAADYVVGQPSFATTGANAGALPMYQPEGAHFTASGLLVAGYFGPGVSHLPPVTSSNPSSDATLLPSGYSLVNPDVVTLGGAIGITPAGDLIARDYAREVVATLPASGPSTVRFVLGQPDPTRIVTSPTSASVVASQPAPVGYVEQGVGDGKLVLVPDYHRLLVFDQTPAYNFAPASRVVGQAGFTTNGEVDYRGISASTLAGPSDVAASGTTLAVADRGNNRVLLYSTASIAATNAPATVVVGQPDATSYVPNVDQKTPGASTLSGPSGIALDGTHLIVADSENQRVLIWNTVPTTNGAAADIVLGQSDFTGRSPNHGNLDANGDGFSDADATGFFYPTGVASDGTHLFVADRLNNRVLVWRTFPTANGQAADAVLGQPSFSASQSNANLGGFATVANGFNLPSGLFLAGTSLYVADSENNRVARWDTVTTTPTPGAFFGQASGTALANANYEPQNGGRPGLPSNPAPSTTASSLLHPLGVTVAANVVYVTDADSNRVHLFGATSLAPIGELGQNADAVGTANTNGLGAASLATPWGLASDATHLWVADSANHRVLGYPDTTQPATGASATIVLGQSSFLTGGFNQTSSAAGGATSQPNGMAIAGGRLFVADTNNNRITVFATPVTAGQQPTLVLGQPNGTLALPNSGTGMSASTLSGPRGIYADAAHVIVADTGNNRVLVYDPTSTSGVATLVLGQPGFTTSAAPSAPTSASMNGPTGAYTDGTSLWVADTANHRVLVWDAFPTSNGQPADLVLGQTGATGNLPNQGGSAAAAGTLAFPSDVLAVGGVLYVADSGNNRVVFFSTKPTASGAAADGVLGQAGLTDRLAAVTPGDLAHLAGPVKLASDGENLYAADRDLGRVVVYGLGAATSGAAATRTIGVQGGLTIQSPGGVAVQATPFFTSQLYISDTGTSRIDVVATISRLAGE